MQKVNVKLQHKKKNDKRKTIKEKKTKLTIKAEHSP